MRWVTHPATAALGLATLLALPVAAPFLTPSHTPLYHMAGSVSPVVFAATLYLLLHWLLLAALLCAVERHPRPRTFVWTALIALLPWIALKVWSALMEYRLNHHLSLTVFAASILTAALTTTLARPTFLRVFSRLQTLTATMLGFCAPCGLLVLSQLLWIAWQTRAINAPMPLHRPTASSSAPRPHPRIVWLVLDELSYQQVYERRFPGLQLPAFDRLAQQATLFTQVDPAGIKTEYVIPSLFSGIPADALHVSSDGRQLQLHRPNTHTWSPFDPHQTVFQDALDRGYSAAAAGWYNPYCRILPQVLDRCLWSNHIPLQTGMSSDLSFARNLLTPLADRLFAVLDLVTPNPNPNPNPKTHGTFRTRMDTQMGSQARIHDYTELLTAADTLLNDDSATFVYLHLPVPHPDGFYNRSTHQLTTAPATYIDNLALADDALAHLRAQLEARHQWDSTTLLVMGDHSWRTILYWKPLPTWTAEEEQASHGGQFDPRPAYLLKLPQQQQPARIDAPFAALRTRALLLQLMEQRIQTPAQLAQWAGQTPPPTSAQQIDSTRNENTQN